MDEFKTIDDAADALTSMVEKPLFRKAATLMPNDHLKQAALTNECQGMTEELLDETDPACGLSVRQVMMAYRRWQLEVCNTCRKKKGNGTSLKRCSCCGLVCYCSRECQRAEWPRHREYVSHLPATPVLWANDPYVVRQ